jgi:hypothetical protein
MEASCSGRKCFKLDCCDDYVIYKLSKTYQIIFIMNKWHLEWLSDMFNYTPIGIYIVFPYILYFHIYCNLPLAFLFSPHFKIYQRNSVSQAP